MQVRNLKLLENVPFDEYLAMPGISYSGIRSEGKEFKAPTVKMRLGTLVHTYLLDPKNYTYENHDIVRPLAVQLQNKLGILVQYLKPELSVTADFCHEGFILPYKGRIDLGIPGRIVVDLKVSDMPLKKGIEFFGYNYQLCGYALAIAAKAALIIGISPKTKLPSIANIELRSDWWEYHIKSKGRVAA